MTLRAEIHVEFDAFMLDIALIIKPGMTAAVVGPNGAGKTTLLGALAGLQPMVAGQIKLDDQTLDDPSTNTFVLPEKRSVGVVFHDNLLFPHLNAIDNVAFGLRAKGMRKAHARKAASEWLMRVGIAERGHAHPTSCRVGKHNALRSCAHWR